MRFGGLVVGLCLANGCNQHDYSVQVDEPSAGPPIANFPETIAARFDISIDVAFQRTNFGQDISRCQFQVALYYYYQSDFLGEGGNNQHIDFPNTAGACLMTEFPEPQSNGQQDDLWQVRGSIDAGETIYLVGRNRDLELHRIEDFGGRIYYDMADCNAETFPFSEVFDLNAPDANMGSDYDALYLEQAIVVGPNLRVTSPEADLVEEGQVFQPNDTDFEMAWEETGEVPELGTERVHHEKLIFLRNAEKGQHHPFEAMACRPSTENSMVIAGTTLQEFTANPSESADDYYTAIQVDAQTIAPATETPWGQLVHSRAVVTDGGVIRLFEP
jgi:hypothetical protein